MHAAKSTMYCANGGSTAPQQRSSRCCRLAAAKMRLRWLKRPGCRRNVVASRAIGGRSEAVEAPPKEGRSTSEGTTRRAGLLDLELELELQLELDLDLDGPGAARNVGVGCSTSMVPAARYMAARHWASLCASCEWR